MRNAIICIVRLTSFSLLGEDKKQIPFVWSMGISAGVMSPVLETKSPIIIPSSGNEDEGFCSNSSEFAAFF